MRDLQVVCTCCYEIACGVKVLQNQLIEGMSRCCKSECTTKKSGQGQGCRVGWFLTLCGMVATGQSVVAGGKWGQRYKSVSLYNGLVWGRARGCCRNLSVDAGLVNLSARSHSRTDLLRGGRAQCTQEHPNAWRETWLQTRLGRKSLGKQTSRRNEHREEDPHCSY